MKYYEQEGFIQVMQEEVSIRKSIHIIDIDGMKLIFDHLSKHRKGTEQPVMIKTLKKHE